MKEPRKPVPSLLAYLIVFGAWSVLRLPWTWWAVVLQVVIVELWTWSQQKKYEADYATWVGQMRARPGDREQLPQESRAGRVASSGPYATAAGELDSPFRDDEVWYQSLAEAEGDEARARAKYIASRAGALQEQQKSAPS